MFGDGGKGMGAMMSGGRVAMTLSGGCGWEGEQG